MKNLFKKLVLIVVAMTLGLGTMFGFTACGSDDTIVVYTEAGFAPFEYVSGKNIVGVDVDIMNLVGKKLGKEVKFENVSFDTIVDSVSQGKLCKVGAAGISVTEERKEKVAFSDEYYTAKLYVIYRVADESKYVSKTTDNVDGVYWDSLAGKKIAVQGGTTADLFLGDELAEGGILAGTTSEPTRFSSLATATADVKAENSDVLIIDELPAQKLVEKESSLKCAPLYYKGGEGEKDEAATDVYAICVTKGEDELLDAINEVLKELGKEGIEELVQKHLGVK
ncbi:MAG: transporter substrate-binding domain-containing protein [Clostridiales bacterium]|nr:transporter substrate-binding domain-containing protein [Clostridiales bacterium]